MLCQHRFGMKLDSIQRKRTMFDGHRNHVVKTRGDDQFPSAVLPRQ